MTDPPASPSAEDCLTVGPVTLTDFVRYAGASGDFNPLHHDDAFARDAGFPSPFAMGMFSAGLIGAWLSGQADPRRLRRLRIRFEQQVWPQDVLTIQGTRAPAPDMDGDEYAIECRRSDGALVSRGWALMAGS
ncbi:MaoC domain protein dehydratase [Mycolicibacterium rhodesiae JS60]|nr:MaoC domain protein dehydratase [Mycolicibacterium rhodesiae JS60]